MVNIVAGGTMGEKIAETTKLYEMLGTNSQQKSLRGRMVWQHS